MKSKISPGLSSIGTARSPVRISGPFMSIMMATSRSILALTALIRLMIILVQSCEAWAMLSRITSAPSRINRSSISSLSVAGPRV